MIAIASDHGGYALKEHIKAYLAAKGITCQDFGCETRTGAITLFSARLPPRPWPPGQCEKGIVICTTGIGISISANKVKGIRCAPVRGYPVRPRCAAATTMPTCWLWGRVSWAPTWRSGWWTCFCPPNSTAAPHQAGRADDGDRGLSPAEKCSGDKKGIDKQLPVR